MATLANTNLALSAVRTYLGYLPLDYSLFNIGISALVNKWSRFKPVRAAGACGETDARWKGDDGKCGFNLGGANPNKWDYLKPRGGSPGGSPDEPVRLGDFRGYNQAKGLENINSGPPVYCNYANQTSGVAMQPQISTYNIIARTLLFRFRKNTVSNSIRILASDIGLDSYYWGIKLCSPSSCYYKTLSNLNNLATITLDLLFTNPSTLTFSNGFGWPSDAETGTWTAQLFISSSPATSWTGTAPSDIIFLPTDSDLTDLISGFTINLKSYIVFGVGNYTSIAALPASGNFPVGLGDWTSNYEFGRVNTNYSASRYNCARYDSSGENAVTWFNFRLYDSSNVNALASANTNDNAAVDATYVRIFCNANTGNARVGMLRLYNSDGARTDITINQAGAPPTFNYQDNWASPHWSVTPTTSNPANGDINLHVYGKPSGFYSGAGTRTMYLNIKDDASNIIGSDSWGAKDGVAFDRTITVSPAFGGGVYTLDFGDGS